MDNENDTNAQVQDTQPDTGNPVDQQQTPEAPKENQHQGYQARIDELTRARHEMARQNAELTATVARLAAQVAETGRQAPQGPQLPELDPEQKQVLDAYFQNHVAPLRQELEQARMAAFAGQLYQASPGEDPRVLQRAQELLPAVLKAGWAASDALNFARGEIYAQERGGQVQARDERGRFNSQGHVMTASGAPPPPQQRGAAPLPPNFDSLPPDKQLEILEKRGVQNAPLFPDSGDW